MDKDLEKRLQGIEKFLDRLRRQQARSAKKRDVTDRPAHVPGEATRCQRCSDSVDSTLNRVERTTSALELHVPRPDGDVRDRLVTETILSDLSAATAHFRHVLADCEMNTAAALKGVHALARDLELAEGLFQPKEEVPDITSSRTAPSENGTLHDAGGNAR